MGDKKCKLLSPWGLVSQDEIYISGRRYNVYDIAGVELGQKKLDHSEFDTFKEFYSGNWKKFVDYNIIDVELVDRLEDKMKLIELALTMAYDAKVNYQDVMYQVRMWDTIIYNYLKKRNIVIPLSLIHI